MIGTVIGIVIGTITMVIVLDVWSKREKAFPWGTETQCHMLQADNLGLLQCHLNHVNGRTLL